jgi:hypothetical protein
MRFMMLVKSDVKAESAALPDEKALSEMGKYNDELVKAGALLAAEGLTPSSKGARVRYSGGKFTVTDGPFTEAKELVAGFWVIQARSSSWKTFRSRPMRRRTDGGGRNSAFARARDSRRDRDAGAAGARDTYFCFRASPAAVRSQPRIAARGRSSRERSFR